MRVLTKMPVLQKKRFELSCRLGTGGFRFKCPASAKVDDRLSKVKNAGNPFAAVFRSKGFVWLAHDPQIAYYWAHSGPHLELAAHASWWADLPKSKWPKENESSILQRFEGEFDDRRQELVLMGTKLEREKLEALLDQCLLADEEMDDFRRHSREMAEQQQNITISRKQNS